MSLASGVGPVIPRDQDQRGDEDGDHGDQQREFGRAHRLLAAEHEIALLLTRPDKPRGRGRKLAPTAAKETAERLGIPVAQPAKLDGSIELPAETVVVAAYGLLGNSGDPSLDNSCPSLSP